MGLPTQELQLIDEHGDENPPIESNRATVESHILSRPGQGFLFAGFYACPRDHIELVFFPWRWSQA